MAQRRLWSTPEMESLRSMAEAGHTAAEVADALGRSRQAIYHRAMKEGVAFDKRARTPGAPNPPPTSQEWTQKERGDTLEITIAKTPIRTLDQVIEQFEVDLDVWEAPEMETNAWPSPIAGGDGAWIQMYQIKVRWKRRKPEVADEPAVILPSPISFAPPRLPKGSAVARIGGYRVLVFGDVHLGNDMHGHRIGRPSHDSRALSIILRSIEQVRADMIVINGDLFNFYYISRHPKSSMASPLMTQAELSMGGALLSLIRDAAGPNCRIVLMGGNHDEIRIDNIMNDGAGKSSEARQIFALDSVRNALMIENLLPLAQLNIEHVPYGPKGQGTLKVFDDLVIKHGAVAANGSTRSVLKEMAKYPGRDVIINHVHRLGAVYVRDRAGYEAGCVCSTEVEYADRPDWQQGFLVREYSADRRYSQTDLIRIQDGRAIVHGREIVGNESDLADMERVGREVLMAA